MKVESSGPLFEWRGPSPYHFVALPSEACEDVSELAAEVTYGWGVVPVSVVIGSTDFTTSLIPREGGYLLPVKDKVRRAEGLNLDDVVEVALMVGR